MRRGVIWTINSFAEQERQRPNASGYTVHYPTKIDEKPFMIFKFYYRPEGSILTSLQHEIAIY